MSINRPKQCPLPRISGQLYMMQVTEATSKTNCPKNIFSLPYLETPKDIATKSGETHVKLFTPIGERYLSPGKNAYVSLFGTPLRATVPCYTVLESSR